MGYYIAMSYIKFFFLIFVISLIFESFYDIKGKKKALYLSVVFGIFFIVMGFRHYGMGNDTANYYAMFLRIARTNSIERYIESSDVESGYVLYNWLLAQISNNPRILFVTTSAIICISLAIFVYRNVSHPGVFCCLFVGLLQFGFFLSAMRQAIAVSILLYAVDALIRKRRLLFVLLCLLAARFHNSAYAMLAMSMLLWNNESKAENGNVITYIVMFVVVVVFSVFFDRVWNGLLSIFPKYDYYTGTELTDGEPRLAIILKVAVYILLFISPKIFKFKYEEKIELYNVGQKMSLIQIAMYMIASNATALGRLAGIFTVFAVAHFSNSFPRRMNRENIIFLLVTLAFVFLYGLIIVILKTPDWQTTYPIHLQFESIF